MAEESTKVEGMVECHYNGTIIYVPVKLFLRVLMEMQFDGKKYTRYKEGAKIYSMSERSFYLLANEADAVYHVKGMALVNIAELDEYMKYFKE